MTRRPTSRPFSRARGGFTLIELLIVVMLIGILSALSTPFLIAARTSANEASAIQSMQDTGGTAPAEPFTAGGTISPLESN